MLDRLQSPEFVYHGSPEGNIELFTPRVSFGSGEKYGAQVYASNDIVVASMFMANVGTSWSTGEKGGVLYAIIPLNREDFIQKDKGGFIYKLPGESFSSVPERGMGDKEWASSIAVKPLDKIRIDSVLDTMIENDVQVYFVDDAKYEEMCSSGQPKWQFLQDLMSENQLRELGVKSF